MTIYIFIYESRKYSYCRVSRNNQRFKTISIIDKLYWISDKAAPKN